MTFNLFGRHRHDMIQPTTRVYRTQTVEGYSIPAIIHNVQYHFIDLDVYENGRVHCWNFEDLEHFKRDVQRGWVVSSIPDNDDISIFGLGSWSIGSGDWIFNKTAFSNYVVELIKQLNPKMENIFSCQEKKINGVTVGENGKGTIYKEQRSGPNDIFRGKTDGESINLFYKVADSEYFLTKVIVYSDGILEISRLEAPIVVNIDELEAFVNEGKLLTDIPIGSTVRIYGLGKFSIQKVLYCASVREKILEIRDLQRRLRGEPTTIEICRIAHRCYLENPTIDSRDKLRIAYENVPDHQKVFVGNMDTKDIEVRMIIYDEQEIERWPHYQIAKERGDDLPSLKVPRPRDE